MSRLHHLRIDPAGTEILLKSRLSCLVCVILAARVSCCGGRVRPPMIQNFRNMHDSGPGCTEQKVIILCAIIFRAQSKRQKQFLFHDQKVTDIIVAQKIIRIKIRLPVRLKEFSSRRITLVLIRVNDLRLCPLDLMRHFKDGILRQKIVIIQESNIIPGSHGCRGIGIS